MNCQEPNFFQKIICFIKYHLLKMRLRNPKNSMLYKHAKYELDLILNSLKHSNDPNDYKMQKELNNNLLKMVEEFCKYGHSGGSAKYQLDNFVRLMNYKPLFPLTGNNDEWVEITDFYGNHEEKVYQNKRYSSLFKNVDFDEETGEITKTSFNDINLTEIESKDITFPYYPK